MKKPLALTISAALITGALLAPNYLAPVQAQEPSASKTGRASQAQTPLADAELTALLDAYEAGKMASVIDLGMAALQKAPTSPQAEKRLMVINGLVGIAMQADFVKAGLYQRALAAYQSSPTDALAHFVLKLAERKGDIATIEKLQGDLGMITGWCVVGPFDNERGAGFGEAYGPEATLVDFEEVFEGKAGREVSWRPLPVPALAGKLELDSLFNPHDEVLAYAATTIHADADGVAELRLASDEGYRVWVNGREIPNTMRARGEEPSYGGHLHREGTFDQTILHAKLSKGANLIVVKVTEAEGNWDLRLRVKSALKLTLGTPAEVATWQNRFPGPDDFEFGEAESLGTLDPEPQSISDRFTEALHELILQPSERKERVAMKRLTRIKDEAFTTLSTADQARLLFALANASRSTAETSAGVDENAKREMLLEVLKLNPNHYGALMAMVEHYSKTLQNPNLAETYAKRAEGVAPTLEAKMAVAKVLLDRNLIDAYWDKVKSFEKTEGELFDPTLLSHLAWHAIQQERVNDTLAYNQRMLDLDHRAAAARNFLMDEALRTGDAAKYEAMLAEGKRLSPFATSFHSKHADYLAAKKGAEGKTFEREALQEVQAALAIAPQDDELLSKAANLAKRIADSAKRAAEFQGVTEIDGTPVGEVSEQHIRMAREFYERALVVNPGRSDIKRYIEFLDDKKPIWEERLQSDMSEFFKEELKKETDPALVLSISYVESISEVNSDGTSADYGHIALRIENNQGRMGLRQFQLPFGGDIKIVNARLWRAADGSNEPSKVEGQTIINGSLELGDIIEVTFRSYNDETGFFGDFYGDIESFQGLGGLPVSKARRTWVLPANKEYHFYETAGVPAKQETIEDGKRIVRYEMNQIAKVEQEPLSPNARQAAPTVYLSSFKSWEKFGAWYWNLIERQVKSTPAIVEKVAELTAGLESEEDKVRAIYNFTVQNIRYNAEWEFGVHGYKPYEAGAIFDRCIGDCKDKAILIVTMLREAGIKAYPVLINLEMLRGVEDISSPAPFHFNHAIAYVEFATGEGRFLDGTTTFSAYDEPPVGDAGAQVVVIKPTGGVRMQVPAFDPKMNQDIVTSTLTLEVNGDAQMTYANAPLGYAASALREGFVNEGMRKTMLEGMLSEYAAGVSVDKVETSALTDLNTKVTMSFNAKLPNYAQTKDGIVEVRARLQNMDYTQTALGYLDERQNDLVLPPINGESSTLTIVAPAGYELAELPADVKVESAHFDYSISFAKTDAGIEVKRWMAFKGPVVKVADYKTFREGMIKAASGDRTKLVFTKTK